MISEEIQKLLDAEEDKSKRYYLKKRLVEGKVRRYFIINDEERDLLKQRLEEIRSAKNGKGVE